MALGLGFKRNEKKTLLTSARFQESIKWKWQKRTGQKVPFNLIFSNCNTKISTIKTAGDRIHKRQSKNTFSLCSFYSQIIFQFLDSKAF